jgi:hypothetical protein
VNKMLEEIKEVRKVISKWKSVEHVGWKLGIKPKKENSIKKIISENISEIMKRIDDEINRLKPILKEFRSNKNVKKN